MNKLMKKEEMLSFIERNFPNCRKTVELPTQEHVKFYNSFKAFTTEIVSEFFECNEKDEQHTELHLQKINSALNVILSYGVHLGVKYGESIYAEETQQPQNN